MTTFLCGHSGTPSTLDPSLYVDAYNVTLVNSATGNTTLRNDYPSQLQNGLKMVSHLSSTAIADPAHLSEKGFTTQTFNGVSLPVYDFGYEGRFSFIKFDNATTGDDVVDTVCLGTYGIVSQVFGAKHWVYMLHPAAGDDTIASNLSISDLWMRCSDDSRETPANPNVIPDSYRRFKVYRHADNRISLRCVAYSYVGGYPSNNGGFTKSDDITSASGLVTKFALESTTRLRPVLPSTINATTGAITEKFSYYITAPHTMTATPLAGETLGYKQLTGTAGALSVTSGYDNNTQAFVFEATATPNVYRMRTVGDATWIVPDGTHSTVEIAPHPLTFAAFSIRCAEHNSTLKRFLSYTPAGVLSWATATSAASANFAFFIRPGPSSHPMPTVPITP